MSIDVQTFQKQVNQLCMNEQIRWDDLSVVLAVSDTGSLSGAGRRLRLSHATVFRRLKAMEQRLGVVLFERTRGGYAPTSAGADLAEVARRMQADIQAAERRVIGRDLALSGTLRITTTDTLLEGLLTPVLASFRADHPDIHLEVTLSNEVFNLSERDADVAIRPTDSPPDHLVGRRIGRIEQAVYGHRDYDQGQPDQDALWIGPDRHLGYRALDRWFARQGLDRQCRFRTDSMLAMKTAAVGGLGLSVLPCYLADACPSLTRRGPVIDELATDLWILTHPDLRRVARVRTFMRHVADGLPAVQAGLSESGE